MKKNPQSVCDASPAPDTELQTLSAFLNVQFFSHNPTDLARRRHFQSSCVDLMFCCRLCVSCAAGEKGQKREKVGCESRSARFPRAVFRLAGSLIKKTFFVGVLMFSLLNSNLSFFSSSSSSLPLRRRSVSLLVCLLSTSVFCLPNLHVGSCRHQSPRIV